MGPARAWSRAAMKDQLRDLDDLSDLVRGNAVHVQQTVHDIQSRNLLMSLAGLMETAIEADACERVGGLILLEPACALAAQANAQPDSIILLD